MKGLLHFLLFNAAVMGKASVVRALIGMGADPNARHSMWMGVETVDEDGNILAIEPPRQILTTVLMSAAAAGRTEIVRLLLERGADIEAQDADGRTALMSAVIMDHASVVQLLLTRGADTAARDCQGHTALGWARHLEKQNVIPLLESSGAPE